MDGQPDLAALFSAIARRLVKEEAPILAAHGVSMWEYSVLYCLAHRDAETQAALAQAIGYDKTRLIRVLDSLQERGLIVRRPDPRDRRAHVVRLTEAGSAHFSAVQSDIRRMEERLLGELDTPELGTAGAEALVASLKRLSSARD